jgi:hypothetical protein
VPASVQFVFILKQWKQDPNRKKKDCGVYHWEGCEVPLSRREAERMKDYFKKKDIEGYFRTFPEDRQ